MQIPQSQWVELGGPLHYLDFGGPRSAPLLLCVHGLGGSALNWVALAPELTSEYRVIALDLPAHGRTPVAGRSVAVRHLRGMVHRFLTEVAGTPAVLVGNSMGGMISILQAARHPDTVSGLVLVDPALPAALPASPDPVVVLMFATYALPRVGEFALRGHRRRYSVAQQVDHMMRLCCARPDRVPTELIAASIALAEERAEHQDLDAGFLTAARTLLAVLGRPDRYWRAMRAIDVPVLLLHGAQDRLVPLAAARRAARRLGWQLAVHAEAGHVPQMEDPAWTARTVRDWLTGLPGPIAAARLDEGTEGGPDERTGARPDERTA